MMLLLGNSKQTALSVYIVLLYNEQGWSFWKAKFFRGTNIFRLVVPRDVPLEGRPGMLRDVPNAATESESFSSEKTIII